MKRTAIEAALVESGLAIQPFQRNFLAHSFAPGVGIGALSMARGGGKTELIGRVAGLGVLPDSPVFRAGHEVVVFAGSMRQARHGRLALISFRDARLERDTSGNVKMRKAHRRNRDDVAQAAVLAMSAATRMPAPRRGCRVHVRFVSAVSCGGIPSFPEAFEASAEDAASQGEDGIGAVDGPVHAGALEARPDGMFATGFDDAGGDAQAPGPEGGIAHALTVADEIVDALAGLVAGSSVSGFRGQASNF